MKATLEKVAATRNGAGLLVTLRITQATERVHTYRVTDEEYQSAGAPSEGDVLEGDALAVLTEREDTRLAYERALKILAAGDNTRAALLRKLRERGFSQVVSEAAVARALEKRKCFSASLPFTPSAFGGRESLFPPYCKRAFPVKA